ncbi:PREDICTED: uncharacterized protein LOC109224308 [Nicotiana attenuata]|uniref:uncharacterized protein LOC109224308 n=1 Tax=Nicotiana attenuata TaxID=49451 RepID=UPI000904F08B|nr:PREDICTED: uncharacterized protein LOC109224308 [Nicotiana attenuata]
MAPEEKKGGNAHKMTKSMPFLKCTMDCSIIDVGFIGSTFTWCNGRILENRVWERLDRVLINTEWSQKFADTSMIHLVRIGSDHSSLLIIVAVPQQTTQRYFKFLYFWIQEPGVNDILKQAWAEKVNGSPLW